MIKNTFVFTSRSTMALSALVLGLMIAAPVSALAQCEGKTTDRDGDGLTNCVERYVTHTDVRNADTDHDGLSDGLEVSAGLDPVSADADNDGLDDGNEALAGTNPSVSDSDQDGIDDASDPDPAGHLTEGISGTIEAVNVAGQTITVLGVSVDVSGASFEHVADINGLSAGMHVEIRLDPAAAAQGVYHATSVQVDDSNGDGVIDDGNDSSSSGGSGDGATDTSPDGAGN